ncbi:MAG TPA: thioredoxin family protein [Candidatus Binatia bacterium]|nr:thioredoxin family protein [Candidatus Binatia bacterium]
MKSIVIGLLLGFMAWQVSAGEEQWTTDLSKAQEKAKKEKKLVLVDFTGSDWCPPCKALHKNVFTSEEFLKYAKDNLVLVELDFPHGKQQSEELKRTNKELMDKYKVEGLPTVIVFDSEGKQLKRESGYDGTKPAQYIAKLKKLQKA